MRFEDATLVKLATPAARDALFDATALEQFVAALYDTSFVTAQAPFQALFDDLQLGLAVPRTGFAEGEWAPLGSSDTGDIAALGARAKTLTKVR